uniref:G-protein coupled receptors family 2 profile 2 domain-containing protein n=1 Tax=Amphimedon queenslandica TaxID=400682 RepID=A0A1X7T4D3_AMPQE
MFGGADIPEDNVIPVCYKFDNSQARRIGVARAASGVSTLIVSLVAIVIILSMKAIKQYPQRLFFYLTLATLIQAPTFTLEVLSVSYNRMRVIVLRLTVYNKKLEVFLLILFLVLPIPGALIPLIKNKYGMVGAWCWIKDFNSTDCVRHDNLGIAYQSCVMRSWIHR